LSDHITDDIPRILELTSAETGTASREVVEEIVPPEAPAAATNMDIPSPEELDAVKRDAHVTPDDPTPQPEAAPIDTQDTPDPTDGLSSVETVVETITEVPQEAVVSEPPPPVETDQVGSQANVESAVTAVTDILGAEEVKEGTINCETCGLEVTDTDLQELTQIRFQKWLCRPHFKEMLTTK
jgi:hypothetical protein